MPGMIKNRLPVFAHGGELAGADVESIIHRLVGQGATQPAGLAQIFNVQQLVTISAVANHGKTTAVHGPVVQQSKHAKTFGTDETFGPDNGNNHSLGPEFFAHAFGHDLGIAIRSHSIHVIGFQQRMMIGNTINRGG